MIQDGVKKVPQVPVRGAPDTLHRSRGRQTEEKDEDVHKKDTGALDPAGVAGLFAVAGEVGLVDEHGGETTHDDVDAAHNQPAERRGLRGDGDGGVGGVGGVHAGNAAAVGETPAKEAESGKGHDEALDGKDVVDLARVDPCEGELEKPHDEKSEELFRRNVRRQGQSVGPVGPAVAKHAAEADGEEVGAVVGLDAVPDDADDGADEDEKIRAPYAHDGAGEDRVANVVFDAWARHAYDHEAGDEGAEDAGDEGLLPGEAHGDEGGGDVPTGCAKHC